LDNVYKDDIATAVCTAKETGQSSQAAAETLAKLAEANSCRKDFFSPFAQGAREAGQKHDGGKRDDITVLVAYVMPDVQRGSAGYSATRD